MHPRLQAAGHRLVAPTCTGLGERAHLASPAVDLETHIADILGVLEFEDLRDVILVGHSYGGMVATGVAQRAPGRLAQLVYLDAMLPRPGQSAFDLHPEDVRERMREAARSSGEGWRIPPNPLPPDTSAEDAAWIGPRRLPQPIGTFEQPLRLDGPEPQLPRSYVYCRRAARGDFFRQFADRVRGAPGWRSFEIDASHSPHVTAPDELARLLAEIAATAS